MNITPGKLIFNLRPVSNEKVTIENIKIPAPQKERVKTGTK